MQTNRYPLFWWAVGIFVGAKLQTSMSFFWGLTGPKTTWIAMGIYGLVVLGALSGYPLKRKPLAILSCLVLGLLLGGTRTWGWQNTAWQKHSTNHKLCEQNAALPPVNRLSVAVLQNRRSGQLLQISWQENQLRLWTKPTNRLKSGRTYTITDVAWRLTCIKPDLWHEINPSRSDPAGFFKYLLFSYRTDAIGHLQFRVHSERPGRFMHLTKQKEAFLDWITDRISNPNLAGFIAGLHWGDKSSLSQPINNLFIRAGLSHYLAASGYHLGVFLGIFAFWIRGRGSFARLFTLLAALCYLVLCDFPVSLVRCFVFLCLYHLLTWLDREARPIHLVSLCVIVLVLWDPAYSLSIAFKLSISAWGGILVFAGPVYDFLKQALFSHPPQNHFARLNQRLLKVVLAAAVTSFIAWTFTAGTVFITFGKFSPYFLLSNLMALPVLSIGLVVQWIGFIFFQVEWPFEWGFIFLENAYVALLSGLAYIEKWPSFSVSVERWSILSIVVLQIICLLPILYITLAGKRNLYAAPLLRLTNAGIYFVFMSTVVLVSGMCSQPSIMLTTSSKPKPPLWSSCPANTKSKWAPVLKGSNHKKLTLKSIQNTPTEEHKFHSLVLPMPANLDVSCSNRNRFNRYLTSWTKVYPNVSGFYFYKLRLYFIKRR